MPSKSEKARRKEIQKQLKQKEINEFLSGLPIDENLMNQLFEYLDYELSEEYCDHNFKLTNNFFENLNVEPDRTIEWLKNNGAYCDCEILLNVEEKFE